MMHLTRGQVLGIWSKLSADIGATVSLLGKDNYGAINISINHPPPFNRIERFLIKENGDSIPLDAPAPATTENEEETPLQPQPNQ